MQTRQEALGSGEELDTGVMEGVGAGVTADSTPVAPAIDSAICESPRQTRELSTNWLVVVATRQLVVVAALAATDPEQDALNDLIIHD